MWCLILTVNRILPIEKKKKQQLSAVEMPGSFDFMINTERKPAASSNQEFNKVRAVHLGFHVILFL